MKCYAKWYAADSSLFIALVKATEVKMNDVEFNPEFVSRIIPKLEWSVLVKAAEEVSVTPMTLPPVSRFCISFLCFEFFVCDVLSFLFIYLCVLLTYSWSLRPSLVPNQ